MKKKQQKKKREREDYSAVLNAIKNSASSFDESLSEEGFRCIQDIRTLISRRFDHVGEHFFPTLLSEAKDTTLETLCRGIWKRNGIPLPQNKDAEESFMLFSKFADALMVSEGIEVEFAIWLRSNTQELFTIYSSIGYWIIAEHLKRCGLVTYTPPLTPFEGEFLRAELTPKAETTPKRDFEEVLDFHWGVICRAEREIFGVT